MGCKRLARTTGWISYETTVLLSIGLEDVDDLIEDLSRALYASQIA